jgi:lysozyme
VSRKLILVLAVAACSAPDESEESSALTTQCATQSVEGVDVYAGTGTIDWAMVKASGRQFAFIKATQGDYNKQANFAANWTNAQAAGVLRSPYHFFDGTKDGVAQANWFLGEITAAGGLQPGDLPPMLDIECPTSSVQANAQSNCEFTGDSGWVATATLVQRVFDWLATVEQATGRMPIIYSYPSWFASAKVTDARLAAYPLFNATYGSCASVPAPWTSAVFWQYSATTRVPGITAAGDVDRFFGTPDQLVGLTMPVVPPDAGVGDADPGLADANVNPETGMRGGCGCRTGSGAGSLWWIAIGVLVLRRRR